MSGEATATPPNEAVQALVEAALASCRGRVEAGEDALNITTVAGAGEPVLTLFWGFSSDQSKSEVAMLWGRLVRSLGGDLLITVLDTWLHILSAENDPEGFAAAERGEYPMTRPSERPDRVEMFDVQVLTTAGLAWHATQQYRRTDDGADFDALSWDDAEISGPILDAHVNEDVMRLLGLA